MKLFYSPASPFVRKVLVVAHELGLAGAIERLPAAAGPVARDPAIRPHNPLGQVPTLLLDDGTALYDSQVICEYLDARAGGDLFGTGAARWRNLTDAALGDGLLGAALLARYEGLLRPEALRWPDWVEGQMGKVADALDRIEAGAGDPAGGLAGRRDIGAITLACGLGYLDFRFPGRGWRADHPRASAWYEAFATRPAMQATIPA